MEKSTMYMKFSTIVLFLIGFSVLFNLTFFEPTNKGEITLPAQEGVAVIELFTSQGCSSCPSADRLLSQLIDQAETNELPVYGLSFHVDYWNRLGWKDPFSAKAYTERQYAYARKIEKASVYTPQMVVNGQEEFVGSNGWAAEKAIKKASNTADEVSFIVEKISKKDGQISFSYLATGTKSQQLNIALVERGIETYVKRGENGGRTLKHDNVVRAFEQQSLQTEDEITIALPADIDLAKSSIILYAQDGQSLAINGATRVSLAELAG